ncbi:MAG: hypothetical protein L3K05_05070, partial [Thermoplasmata archaeon]|nr:hypothetical protein [Thermoplasmata archaeon]
AYTQNAWPNALQWTPGGELPAVFAFETGHTAPPYPNNNSYGGCSAGSPVSTYQDPAAPCPSYDPGSWVNDTLTPWHIAVPTFSNATATEQSAQVSFTQDLGGISFIDPISNYTCAGLDGSAWCSYPWYSYNCGIHAFEFGATDYPGVSTDFGQYDEYARAAEQDGQQFYFYPPTNFSVPTCGAASYSLTLTPSPTTLGATYFLSTPYRSATVVTGLGAGEYSLSAIPIAGARFVDWVATSGATVVSPTDPDTTVWLTGDGTVTAYFSSSTVNTTVVTFDDSPSTGHIAVFAGILYTSGVPLATLANGGTLDLAPGTYSVQAYPVPGDNFSKWSVAGDAAAVAAPALPYTWLTIPGTTASVTVKATSISTSSTAQVYYGTYYGSGNVSFNSGSSVTYGYDSVKVGTYTLVATASGGDAFGGWIDGSPAILSDFEAKSNVTLQNGTTYYMYAYFVATVSLVSAPAADGGISFGSGSPQASQTQVLSAGYYTVFAIPNPTYFFDGWTVSSAADLWAFSSGYGFYYLLVNASGTLTANFGGGESLTNLSFAVLPSFAAGSIEFNLASYAGGTENSSLSNGLFPVQAIPSPGWTLSSLVPSGGVTLPYSGFANVTGALGVLTATFTRSVYTVTFLANAANGASFLVNGTPVANGASALVPSTGVSVTLILPIGPAFLSWVGTPAETISGSVNTTTLFALGPGTVTGLAFGFSAVGGIQPRTTIDLGETVLIAAAASGVGPFSYAWTGVPPGCATTGAASFTCKPNQTGNFTIGVSILGPEAETVTLALGVLTVLSPLAVTNITASPEAFTVGGSSRLTIAATGGLSPYWITFSGLPAGCAGLNVTAFTCRPDIGNGSGLYDVEAVVADGTGATAYASGLLDVNPAPSFAGFIVNRSSVDVGLGVAFTDSVTGGTAPLAVIYSGLPSGCSSSDQFELNCTPTAAGNYTVTVQAVDADGVTANDSIGLVVRALPTINGYGASATTVIVNDTVRLQFTINGGTAPYRVVYSGLPAGCFSANATVLTCVPRIAGSYDVTARVTDSFDQVATAQLNLTVQNATTVVIPPTTSTPSSSSWSSLDTGLVVALLIVIVAVAAVLLLRRRPPAAPPDPGATESEGGDASAWAEPPADPPG